MAITQDNRILKLTTPLAKDFLLIKRMKVREGISQLFSYTIDIIHEETSPGHVPTPVDPKKVIAQPMNVTVKQNDNSTRHFNGICSRFSEGRRDHRSTKYSAELVPRVWLLTQRVQSRIFQHISVSDILRKILTGFDFEISLTGATEKRDYCVQYRESDWDFASRLMEEEGIYYYFEHTADTHKLFISNDPQGHKELTPNATLSFTTDTSPADASRPEAITAWRTDHRFRSGVTSTWDHHFQLPTQTLSASQTSRFAMGGNEKFEVYDYPGGYGRIYDGIDKGGGKQPEELNKVFDESKHTAEMRQQEIDVQVKMSFGTTGNCSMTPGYRFSFAGESKPTTEAQVIVSLQAEMVQSPGYFSDHEVHNPFTSSFATIPHGSGCAPFRPLRQTPKPLISGCQTAIVVGPSGEEIFTDKYGRVKVQFFWDRHGQMNSDSSCWVRVSTLWAGKKWGTFFLPRIGQEVVVDFFEGDPDQPIIVGSVYNAETMPPYELPDNKTRSTIKSNSSTGGSGFNELRFEDKSGEEQIFIHAQKDLETYVVNECKELIGKDRHLIVEGDQMEKVSGDKHLAVIGNQNEKVTGSISREANMSLQEKAGMAYAMDAGTDVHIKAGMKVVIEAGLQLTLKAAGNFVDIGPAGVAINGTMVLINSGGAPGVGSGSSPDAPKEPVKAEEGETGSKSNAGRAPSPPPEPASPSFSALQKAAQAPPSVAPDVPSIPAIMDMAVPPPPALPAVPPEVAGLAEAVEQKADEAVAQLPQPAQELVQAAVAAVQNSPQAQEYLAKAEEAKSKAEAAVAKAKEMADEAKSKIDEAKAKAAEVKAQVEEVKEQAEAYKEMAEGMEQQASAMLQGAKDGLPFG